MVAEKTLIPDEEAKSLTVETENEIRARTKLDKMAVDDGAPCNINKCTGKSVDESRGDSRPIIFEYTSRRHGPTR